MKKLFIAFAIISCFSAKTQELSSSDLDSLREFIAFDLSSTLLIPGETLYLSTWCFDANGNQSLISKIAYLEIINDDRKPIIRKKIELTKGKGSSDVYLPSYLKTGSYTVIVYTRWMKNFSLAEVPQKPIMIVNPYEKLPEDLFTDKPLELMVEFFPENGRYAVGQEQEVGYVITDQRGNHIPLAIKLVNSMGETLYEFHTKESYFGSFPLRPNHEESYRLILLENDGTVHFKDLLINARMPELVSLEDLGDSYLFTPKEAVSDSRLEIWHKGDLQKSVLLDREPIRVDKKELPKGPLLLKIIEFDKDVSRRTLFHSPEKVPVTIRLSKRRLGTREPLAITIEQEQQHTAGLITLVVRKKTIETLSKASTFFFFGKNQLAEVLSRIPENHKKSFIPLFDRNSFDDKTPVKQITFYPDLRGNLIIGKAFDDQLRPISNRRISVSAPGNPYSFYNTISDENGRFYLSTTSSSYTGDYIIYSGKDMDLNVQLEDPFFSDHSFVDLKPLYFDKKLEHWLLERGIEVQVENAYYEGERQAIPDDSTQFVHLSPKSYYLDDFTRFPTVEDPLREYVSEVWVNNNSNNISLSLPSIENKSGEIDTVLTLLNGIPLSTESIMEYDPFDIKRIDVFNEQIKNGLGEYRGVLNFQTFEKEIDELGLSRDYKKVIYQGVPKYHTFQPLDHADKSLDRIPDFRTLLFWSPNLEMRPNQVIELFTSDSPGQYEVIVSGIIGSRQFIFEKTEFEVVE